MAENEHTADCITVRMNILLEDVIRHLRATQIPPPRLMDRLLDACDELQAILDAPANDHEADESVTVQDVATIILASLLSNPRVAFVSKEDNQLHCPPAILVAGLAQEYVDMLNGKGKPAVDGQDSLTIEWPQTIDDEKGH